MYKPEEHNVICTVCPVGCRLTVIREEHEPDGYKVIGGVCKRGEKFGIKEVTNPTRTVTSTVAIEGGLLPRLPVRTEKDIPKELNYELMKLINQVKLQAPVKIGEVVVANVFDTGVNVIATRSMRAVK